MLLYKLLVLGPILRLSDTSTLPADWRERLQPKILQADLKRSMTLVKQEDDAPKLFHGDIELVADDPNAVDYLQKSLIDLGKLQPENFWPDRQNIPYEISKNMGFRGRQNITSALQRITDRTFGCIAFKERSQEPDYIYFAKNPTACMSSVGRRGGKQTVNLAQSCLMAPGDIQHEVMHALGIFHEQSRPDRDIYVELFRNNIESEMFGNFEILPLMETYNVGYDFESVMHYGHNFFARDKLVPTLLPRRGKNIRMGQRRGLSRLDASKLQSAYNCPFDSDDLSVTPNLSESTSSKMALSDTENSSGIYLVPESTRWWKNSTILYQFFPGIPDQVKRKIYGLMNVIESQSCLRFELWPAIGFEVATFLMFGDKVVFFGGPQRGNIVLKKSTLVGKPRLVLGAFLQTLGFYPEHLRHDRDDYVDIVWKNFNADSDYDSAPPRVNEEDMPTFGLPYDFESVSHQQYGVYAHNQTEYTVIPKPQYKMDVNEGNRNTLSAFDAKKVNMVYCRDRPCPQRQGWIRLGTKCYFFTHLADITLAPSEQFGLKPFASAEWSCKNIAAVNADAEQQEVRTFLGAKLRAADLKNVTKVWLAGCQTLDFVNDRVNQEPQCEEKLPFVCEKPIKTK